MSLVGKSVGNYVVKAKLGEGGMGTVYLGEHPLIGKRVAIKVLLDELTSKEDIVQRFFTEAKSVNAIGHQNIVDIIDFGKVRLEGAHSDTVYFIMEYLDGEALGARLRRTGLSFPETLHVMEQACSALLASHEKGIVHRDLKPDNIFLCPRTGDKNFTKLLDFGIAKLTGDGVATSQTRTGTVIGTPAYMSPEQCEGKGQIDHRSDIYSIGIVMYEMLTGRVPFVGEGFGEILVAQLTQLATPPSRLNPEISPALEAIVMHAIEKDRNARFQSMREMLAAVQDPAAHLRTYQSRDNSAYRTASFDEVTRPGPNGPLAVGARPVTTLSAASGETSPHQLAPSGGKAPMFVGAFVLLAGLGVGAYFWKRSPAPVAAAQPTVEAPIVKDAPIAPPVAPAPAKDIHVTIRSTPPGATLIRADNGETLTAPVTLSLAPGASFDVQVKLAGWKPVVRAVSADSDHTIEIKLEAAVVAVAPTAAPKPATPIAKTVKTPVAKTPVAKAKPHPRPGKPGTKPGISIEEDMQIIPPKDGVF